MLAHVGLLGVLAWVAVAGQFAAAAKPLTIEQLYGTPARSAPDLSPDGSRYVSVICGRRGAREIAYFDDPEQRIGWVNLAKPDLVLVSLHETDVPLRLASRARFYAEWLAFFERELAPPAGTES